MILINIDLPELESISSEGYSLWSPRKVVMNAVNRLKRTGTPILGIVLSRVEMDRGKGYYYKRYYRNSDYGKGYYGRGNGKEKSAN